MSQLNQLANTKPNYTNAKDVYYNCISNLNWIRINPVLNPKLHVDKPVTAHLNRHGVILEFLLHSFLQICISINLTGAKELQTVVDNVKTALYAYSLASVNQVIKQKLCDIRFIQPVHPETRLSPTTWNILIFLHVSHVCIGSSTENMCSATHICCIQHSSHIILILFWHYI